jgi:thiol-disulfide isomerase/thioredoxin
MRSSTSTVCLLSLVCLAAGCAQTAAVRSNPSSKLTTVASVGDKPLPIVAGEPGASLRAEPEQLDRPTGTGSRISGRVYDDRGKPVPNAKVRLAVGSAAGGKVVLATTDRSGAFTLPGLRPGSSYTLIAEYEGEDGTVSGRAQAKAPQSDVRIALQPRGDESGQGRSSIRAARPRVEPISNVDPADDEPSDEDGAGARIRSEDLEPPAAEATALSPRRPSRTLSDSSPAGSRTRWSARQTSSRTDQEPKAESRVRDDNGEPGHQSRVSPRAGDDLDDDGPNPLPPALETSAVSSARRAPRSEDKLIKLARNEPDGASKSPQPSGADDAEASSSPEDVVRRRPTWSEVSLGEDNVPLDESLERTAGSSEVSGNGVITLTSANRDGRPTMPRFFGGTRPLLLDQAVKQSVCRFDPAERRLIDFKLPDLSGRLVSLEDIDADLIVLDFWGSWCAPCRKSISHLIEVQSKLGGKRLQVVGIACEKAAAALDRRASAAKAARDLGINYTVLLSGMDGTCPVQRALLVQFYPTMVLLDREGRILAREQGATDATLPRLDRAIAAALRSQDE